MIRFLNIVGIFIIVVFIGIAFGQVVTIGQFLDGIYIWLDTVFYVLLVALLVNVLVLPWINWMMYPTSDEIKKNIGDQNSKKTLKKILRHTTAEEQKTKIRAAISSGDHQKCNELVEEFYKTKFTELTEVVNEHSGRIFRFVAISQNSVLDGVIVLYLNITMLYKIYKELYLRESLKGMLGFYKNTMIQASYAGLFEEFDEEFLELLNEKAVEMIKKVPLADVILTSLLQGVANAYSTAFYGHLTLISFEDELFGTLEDCQNPRKLARSKARSFVLTLVSKPIGDLKNFVKGKFKLGKKNKEKLDLE